MAILLENFLGQVVKGYLFKDLENMSAIQLAAGEDAGAAGYPMVASVNAGIELLGTLLSTTAYNPQKGSEYFSNYWQQMLVPYNHKYGLRVLDKLVYNLVRHGIAHTFSAKTAVLVTKNGGRFHLDVDSAAPHIVIDASRYYQDLKESFKQNFEPAISARKTDMQARLDEVVSQYEQDSKKFFAKLLTENSVRFSLGDITNNLTSSIIASGASTAWGGQPASGNPTISGTGSFTRLP